MQPVFARLDEFIARHMRETGAPGMTLALANRDGLIRASTYGYADTKAGLRVVPETMFEIGSVSKSFVGLRLMQLRDEGKLDVNKPIVEYLPWIKINSKFEAITTHHILSHTGGLPGAPLLLDALLSELWTAYAPGKRFLYSNTGYNILGFLIEALDKRPFADSMRAGLLEPMGMTASSPIITNSLRKLMAVGYEPLNEGKPFPALGPLGEAQWVEVDIAAGSVASTPADMAKYMRMLLNKGALPKGRLLSEEGFALFTKPAIDSPYRGEPASYGYGLWISDVAGHTRLRHTGGMVAFSSSIDVDITGGIGAFASVNANLRGYRPVSVTKYAIDLFNAAAAGKSLPDPPAALPSPFEMRNAADFAGVFTSPDGKKLELVAEGNRLYPRSIAAVESHSNAWVAIALSFIILTLNCSYLASRANSNRLLKPSTELTGTSARSTKVQRRSTRGKSGKALLVTTTTTVRGMAIRGSSCAKASSLQTECNH